MKKFSLLIMIFISSKVFADMDHDLDRIAQCHEKTVELQKELPTDGGDVAMDPTFNKFMVNQGRCLTLQQDFTKKYHRKPKCKFDKHHTSIECKAV